MNRRGLTEPVGGKKRKCPLCGKTFGAFADWAYRLKEPYIHEKIYYCSWPCMRKREKQLEEEKELRKEKRTRRLD